MPTKLITYIDEATGLPTTIESESADLLGAGTEAQRPASGTEVGDLWLLSKDSRWILQRWDGANWKSITSTPPPGGSTDKGIPRFEGVDGQIGSTCVTITDAHEIRHVATDLWAKGANIASAASLVLGSDGNYFEVTGTTTITAVSAKPSGTRVLLYFQGALTVEHHATNLDLRDGVNVSFAAGDHLELISYDGTNWREIGRSEPGGGGGISAGQHRVLDQLVHLLAETSYLEVIRTGGQVSDVISWTNSGKTTKIRETNLTRSGGQVSQIVTKQYDGAGSLVETLTGVVNRTGGQVTSIDWTLT